MHKSKLCFTLLGVLALSLTGCGPDQPSSEISTPSYPECKLNLKASVKEVEVDGKITVRAVVSGKEVEDMTCVFESSDPSVMTVAPNTTSTGCTITGVKAGKATLTVKTNANPNVSKSLEITVIPTIPTLRQVFKNIAALDNYTFSGGYDYGDDEFFEPKTQLRVTEEGILYTDMKGAAVVQDFISNGMTSETIDYYGSFVPSGMTNAVYLTNGKNGYNLNNAPLVRGALGLVGKENIGGYGEKAVNSDDMPYIYSFDAFNPNWLSDEKDWSNTYTIEGGERAENGYSADIYSAYVETLLWKLVDFKSYDETLVANSGNFATAMAASVETTIEVLGPTSIKVRLTVGNDQYLGVLEGQGETTLEDVPVYNQVSKITGAEQEIADDLVKGIEALNSHNYKMENLLYPDHRTEFSYTTYYTPSYVYYDCNEAFKNGYNAYADEGSKWEKDPYGYMKKNDGIYHFVYKDGKVVVDANKIDGTSASSNIYDAAGDHKGYFEAQEVLTTGMRNAFSLAATTIWNNESERYHSTYSAAIADQIIRFYDPQDLPEVYDKGLSGIGVKFAADGTTVDTIHVSAGFSPFITEDNTDDSSHTFGVDRFNISGFGEGTTAPIHNLITAAI